MIVRDAVFVQAVEICYKNPKAKYLILSIDAYNRLRDEPDAKCRFWLDGNKSFFMGKQIAIIDGQGITIDIGGVREWV